MNAIRFKISAVIAGLLLSSIASFAQLRVPFKMRYQSFVKGDMTVIANNVVNRIDYDNSPNDPYYNHTNYAKLNDEFTMKYIDIDDDETTFSSSNAELYFQNPSQKKILYAGLYWSATYKYNTGIQKKADKFVALDEGRASFTNVKLKLPNQEKYVDIVGQTIYDGISDKELKDFAPYAVYADITDYVKKLANPTGVYTVANVRATEGMISGGVAAGWTIFVVYEDQSMTGKFITSFDGFAGVTDKSTDINFNGFQTIPQGAVKAKIACAALEGDNNLIGDQLLFGTNESKGFTQLFNPLRKNNNFFNSSITIENQFFVNRFPDSKNTLGYDTCLISIPNANNSVIGNNTKEAVLRLKSIGDRYFMFFTAYNVEVTVPDSQPLIESENVIADASKEEVKTSKEEFSNANVKLVPASRAMLADGEQSIASKQYTNKTKALSNNKIEPLEIQILNVSNQPKGYYIVANVFSKNENAVSFLSLMKGKGFDAKSFTNPINNYQYIYFAKTDNEQEAINLYLSKMNNTYKDRIWILSVNNSTTLITDNDN